MKYQFGSDSLLYDVTIIHVLDGSRRAYLNARENVPPEQLLNIRKRLSEHGYITNKVLHDGEMKLEVRGFSTDQQLLRNLHLTGAIPNEPTAIELPEQKRGLWEWIKHNTYKACLAFYLIGDVGIITHGYFLEKKSPTNKKNWPAAWSGYFYSAGTLTSIASTWLRGDQSDEQVRAVQEKLCDQLKQDGVDPDKALPFAAEQQKKQNIFARIFVQYPSELLNGCFAVAGLLLSAGAWNELKETKAAEFADPKLLTNKRHLRGKFFERADIALGLLTFASGTLANVVKERPKTSEEKEPEGVLAKTWRWLEEKPLRISGIGYLVATGMHLVSSAFKYEKALHETKSHKQAFIAAGFRAIFGVTNIIAEWLMTISSKGHGEGVTSDKTVAITGAAMAAEAIAKQAPEVQEKLVDKYAAHLASPKVMGGDKKTIKEQIDKHLEAQKKSRWAENISDATATATPAMAGI